MADDPLNYAALQRLWYAEGYDGISAPDGAARRAYDAFPTVPGQMLFVGLRGYDTRGKSSGGKWCPNARDAWNDTICALFIEQDGTKRFIYSTATTDPGRFKKLLNKDGDLWLMPSRGGKKAGEGGGKVYWVTNKVAKTGAPAKHRGRDAFHFVGKVLISRDRDKDGIPGEAGEVAYEWVSARRRGLNFHGGGGGRVGLSSAGCQVTKGWGPIDHLLVLARDAERLCGQTTFGYLLLDELDFS